VRQAFRCRCRFVAPINQSDRKITRTGFLAGGGKKLAIREAQRVVDFECHAVAPIGAKPHYGIEVSTSCQQGWVLSSTTRSVSPPCGGVFLESPRDERSPDVGGKHRSGGDVLLERTWLGAILHFTVMFPVDDIEARAEEIANATQDPAHQRCPPGDEVCQL